MRARGRARSSSEATTDHGRLAELGLGRAAGARGPAAPRPDPLQHRAAGVRPVRDGARHRPGRPPRRPPGPRLGRRDAAVPAGRPAHGLGAAQAGVPHTLIADMAAGRLHGRAARSTSCSSGRTGSPPTATRPTRSARTPLAVLAARHGIPFFVCAADDSIDLDGARRRRDPDRGARGRARSCTSAASRIAPAGDQVRNPAFDVTPAELITGDRHRGGRRPRPVRGRRSAPPSRAAHRPLGRRVAAVTTGPAATSPRRTTRRGRRLMATVAIGAVATTGRRPDRPPTGRCCARSSSATGCSPRTRSATSRTGVRADPLGRRLGGRRRSSPSRSSTTGSRRSRCS